MEAQVAIRVYKAKSQQKAAAAFQKDAQKLSLQGWEVVSQSWAAGQSGCLRLLFMGFIFALIIKPAGSLTVTYRKVTPGPTK